VTTTPSIELISSGHGLLEGPVWHPELGLLVADAQKGGVWSIAPNAPAELHVPHRRGIGGMVLHESGGVVVSGRNVAFKPLTRGGAEAATVVLLPNDVDSGIVGFNDLTTDAAGRVYVGSVSFVAMETVSDDQPPGCLHVIDVDGSSRVVARDVRLTNGLGFSPDGARLYHCDSLRQVVNVYDVGAGGSVGPARLFTAIAHGLPDGLAVSEDGSVWVAIADGHAVSRYASDGREIARIPIPLPMVTSVCFGGRDLRDLYIVTGSRGAPADTGAAVYRVRVDAAGVPRAPARTRIPTSRTSTPQPAR
jgi:sugar lactone lactonase YvrE